MISLFLSVCLCTVSPLKLKNCSTNQAKFGGLIFHGVQIDSSKFGVICLKIKPRRHFFVIIIIIINILLSGDVIT